MHLVVIDIDDVGLVIVHRRNDFGWQRAAHTAKSLGRTLDEHLTAIGRESSAINETILMDEGVEGQGLEIESIQRCEFMWALGTIDSRLFAKRFERVFALGEQHIATILADVGHIAVIVAEGKWTEYTRLDVVDGHRIAVAPAWLTILGIEHLINVLVDLLGTLLADIEDEELLIGRETEAAIGQIAAKDLLGTRSRIDSDKFKAVVARARIVIAVGARHPIHALAELGALTRQTVLKIIPAAILLGSALAFGDEQVVALGRKGEAIA